MRIERIDDKTVKCFLSNRELEEYEIDYKDFITRSPKAKEVVQQIVEQAAHEVGYKPPQFAFDLQIMMVPDQGLLLTLSEKEPDMKDNQQLMECINQMRKMMGQNPTETTQSETHATAVAQPAKPGFAAFLFPSLSSVIDYARMIPANLRVDSQLYAWDESYYLVLRKGGAAYDKYSRACVQALEFAALYTADETMFLTVEEHGCCLIEEKALKVLRK